jgi:hypothetical protein
MFVQFIKSYNFISTSISALKKQLFMKITKLEVGGFVAKSKANSFPRTYFSAQGDFFFGEREPI